MSAPSVAPEYWLISAPSDPSSEETYRKLGEATSDLSSNYKFYIPDLKVSPLSFSLATSYKLIIYG